MTNLNMETTRNLNGGAKIMQAPLALHYIVKHYNGIFGAIWNSIICNAPIIRPIPIIPVFKLFK